MALKNINKNWKNTARNRTNSKADDVRGGFKADSEQSFTYDSKGNKREAPKDNFYRRDTYGTPQYNYSQSFKQSASYTTHAYQSHQ